MDDLFTITFPPKRPLVRRKVVYTNAVYLQTRINELKKTVLKEWEVTDISDESEKTKMELKKMEGYTDIDKEKWGLTEDRWATPSRK